MGYEKKRERVKTNLVKGDNVHVHDLKDYLVKHKSIEEQVLTGDSYATPQRVEVSKAKISRQVEKLSYNENAFQFYSIFFCQGYVSEYLVMYISDLN